MSTSRNGSRKLNKRNKLPSLRLLNQLFRVDVKRGLLIRRVTRAPNALKGAVVGTVDGKGYLHTNLLGKFYRVHRIIFFIHYERDPKSGIDHKNRNKKNNRPKNLRLANDRQNAGNSKMHRHNTSGFRGVSKNSRSGKWHALIKLDGKQTYLGRFDTPEAAAKIYNKAARKHFGRHYVA